MRLKPLRTFLLSSCLCIAPLSIYSSESAHELNRVYEYYCNEPSDIYQHIPVLKGLAEECSSVVEIGVRNVVSTWGILKGLSLSPFPQRSYLGIDISDPPENTFNLAKNLSEANNVNFNFWLANDMTIDIPMTDMLFIDSYHIYAHLSYELEKFSPNVRKYIIMHDTSDPWGYADEPGYGGDYSEYPSFIDQNKKGLWPAIEDFLARHPEWALHQRLLNCHGLTVLRRAGQ